MTTRRPHGARTQLAASRSCRRSHRIPTAQPGAGRRPKRGGRGSGCAGARMSGELIVPPGTTVTSDDGGEPAHWVDIEAGRVDPDLAEHTDNGGQDEQDARAHAMIEADAARRIPRRPWTALKMAYSRNPGVELADITEERAERHQAQQSAVKARLRAAPGQVEDRFNEHTRDAVATRAIGSRRLNKARATADPWPVAQRQSFSFEAEQATWDAYRGGRARGQQSRHAAYGWNMDDGFTY